MESLLRLIVAMATTVVPWLPWSPTPTTTPIVLGSPHVEVSAAAVAVWSPVDYRLIYNDHAFDRRAVASITKLMTAVVLSEQGIDLSDDITIATADQRPGGVLYVFPGETFRAEQLWAAMLVGSSNESAAALVRATGLTDEQFVQLMNRQAVRLGMRQTHFTDITGLSPDNMSTAYDISLLVTAAATVKTITDYADVSHVFISPDDRGQRLVPATNGLAGDVWPHGYFLAATKTGYTPEAGYCFTAAWQMVDHGDVTAVITVLGASTTDSRFSDAQALFESFVTSSPVTNLQVE